VRPAGPGWDRVAARAGKLAPAAPAERLAPGFVNWIMGIVVVYAALFAIGQLLFGEWPSGLMLAVIAVAAAVVLARRV